MAEVDRLPTVNQVLAQVPVGRRPYITAAAELRNITLEKSAFGNPFLGKVSTSSLRNAIHALAEGISEGTLTPPLPEKLGSIITNMSCRASEAECAPEYAQADIREIYGAKTFEPEEYRDAATLAIQAAVDHGSANY